MNITKEQAKMALSVLTAYVEGTSSADLDISTKCLLKLQNSDDFIKLFVDMTQDRNLSITYYYMEEFDDIFRDVLPFDVARGIVYGKFDPTDDFFYLTCDNEIKSVSAYYLLPVAYEHFNEVLEYVIDTNRVNELIKNLEKCDKKE
jgi:hypothetical protein